MFIKKKDFKKIINSIALIGGFIGFQTIGYIDASNCKNIQLREKRYCSIIRRSKTTAFSKIVMSYMRRIYQKRDLLGESFTTSGLAAKSNSELKKRFGNFKSGFNFNYSPGIKKNMGYLLLSAADPLKDGEPLIELWDLKNQDLLFKWKINIKEILNQLGINFQANSTRLRSPLLLDDANLIVPFNEGPLIKLSPEGNILKINDDYIFHHSLEIDSQNLLYIPITPKKYYPNNSWNEGFAVLDKELNILKTFFIKDIYRKAGLYYKLNYFAPSNDPFHINDVEPIRNNLRTKVVLLSLRNNSTILAFDINKEKIIWILEGFTKLQHDVDILDGDGRKISIFDNNVVPDELGNKKSNKNIFTIVDNLPTIEKDSPLRIISYPSTSFNNKEINFYQEKFELLDKNLIPKTITEGNSEYINEINSITIEETNYGRIFEYDVKNNKINWEYINRDDSKDLYFMMGWSRRMKTLPNRVKEILYKSQYQN